MTKKTAKKVTCIRCKKPFKFIEDCQNMCDSCWDADIQEFEGEIMSKDFKEE